MERTWKYIALTAVSILLLSGIALYKYPYKRWQQAEEELEDYRLRYHTMANKFDEQKERNVKYNEWVRSIRDSIQWYEQKYNAQEILIAQLNNQKNEIKRIDYTRTTDDELTQMLVKLFAAEPDSMP